MYATFREALDPDMDYEGKPHDMGLPERPMFYRRVAKGPVRFAQTVELSLERLDDSGLWDTVSSEMVEKVNRGCARPYGKKTEYRPYTKPFISNDNPPKNGRKSLFQHFYLVVLLNYSGCTSTLSTSLITTTRFRAITTQTLW